MNSHRNQIIVYGGTGYYGRNVVRSLLKKDESVRVVSRNANRAKEILGNEVEIFEGDVIDIATIINSLDNVKAIVICLSAMSNKLIKKMKEIEFDAVINIMDEAKRVGIARIVYMSGYEIRKDLLEDLNILDFGEIKLNVEKEISDSDFNWTILGVAPAFEIFFAFIKNGKMVVPGGGYNQIPTISPEDVGELTAQSVVRNDLSNKRIKLTGPSEYSFPEVGELISNTTGKNIKHMKIPLSLVNIISFLLLPFTPFARYLYKSLKMLNNFPPDLAEDVYKEHTLLRETFEYESMTLEMEIERRKNEFI